MVQEKMVLEIHYIAQTQMLAIKMSWVNVLSTGQERIVKVILYIVQTHLLSCY